jgi:uncharacterized protein (TIGR03066 family)
MRAARAALAAVVVVLGGAALAPGDEPKKEKTTAEKLVGTWEWVKGALPPGSTLELTMDGKFRLTKKQVYHWYADHKEVAAGTYTADGEFFKLAGKAGDRDVATIVTVTRLTDSELVTKDDKGRVDELRKTTK